MRIPFEPLCAIIAVPLIAFFIRFLTAGKLTSACTFTEHDLVLLPSIRIQPQDTCSQQELMYFVCSAFFNIGKKRNDIVSFSYQVFPLYFPAGESALAETVPGLEKVRDRRKKNNNSK